VTAIGGSEVADTALSLSLRASYGHGAYMIRQAERTAEPGQATLKLRGTQQGSAPISTIFRSIFKEGNPEVAGTVTVDLTPGTRYRPNGVLDSFRREIWLEDDHGVQVPNSKITAAADPDLAKKMEGAALVTTNLHYDDDWISEVSFLQLPIIPIGARFKVVDWGENKASVLVDGRKMRIGVDQSQDVEKVQQLVARITSDQDPRPKIAAFPERVRNAIRAGRVFPGMTREQVLFSLGRPRVDFNPSLEVAEWKYQIPDQGDIYVLYDQDGLLKSIDASCSARALLMYEAQ
jgi:hypothetical protein